MQSLWGTAKSRRNIAFSIVFSILALSHLLPPDYRHLTWEMWLRGLARIIHGFSEFVVFTLQAMITGPSSLGATIGLILLAPFIGITLSRLWQAPGEGRQIAAFISVSSVLFGAAAVYADSLLVGAPVHECAVTVSERVMLEAVEYPEIGWNPGRHFFLISSLDGGGTWHQVMHVGSTEQFRGCGTLGSFSESFFWYSAGWKLAVTHDGGETWFIWDANDVYREWRCCEESRIDSVEFSDDAVGMMQGFFGSGRPNLLVSNDGGVTWGPP